MEKQFETVGLIQMSMSDDKDRNIEKAMNMTTEAAGKGAHIIVLPELFATTYFCQQPADKAVFSFAELIPGPTSRILAELAKKLGIVLVGGSIFEKTPGGKHYNTSCVFGPDGKMIGSYRKTHIPHDPGFYEQDYFEPGDTGIRVHDTPFGKIAVLICYDQWFPEAARIATLKGADLIVYPTAIGNTDVPPVDPAIPEDWETMWRAVQVGHAAANCVYIAAVNRVGTEGATHFFGGSFVADPNARILAKADDTEQVVLAEIDLSYPKKMQKSWRFLSERKPETYKDLVRPDKMDNGQLKMDN